MTRTTPPLRIAVFERLAEADAAIERLLAAGVARERVSVICPEGSTLAADVEQHEPSKVSTKSGAAVGAASGTALGALVAAAGVAASGGTGLLVAGALLSAGAAMGVVGGFLGAMTARGIEPEIADLYDQALRQGRVLVAVEGATDEVDVDALLSISGGRTFEVPG